MVLHPLFFAKFVFGNADIHKIMDSAENARQASFDCYLFALFSAFFLAFGIVISAGFNMLIL